MAHEPIQNYGVIGNMRTVALVSVRGSIDWFCFPAFDSPSVFGALLDGERGGRFAICPVDEKVVHKQLYWPDTNVLVTRSLSEDGVGEIEDFMPAGIVGAPEWHDQVVRRGSVARGTVELAVNCEPAFGPVRTYGAGESFFEPPGTHHTVSENASATEPATLLAVIVADDGATLTIPDPDGRSP